MQFRYAVTKEHLACYYSHQAVSLMVSRFPVDNPKVYDESTNRQPYKYVTYGTGVNFSKKPHQPHFSYSSKSVIEMKPFFARF